MPQCAGDWALHLGDCYTGLCGLADDSVDALVTDPPAGIGFMGRDWDSDKGGRIPWIEWLQSIAEQSLRAMKPGAHGVVWAIPRTSHWTATALEVAGFEIRDVITHHFGTGFPKSLDVSKAIDEAAGAKREPTGIEPRRPNPRAMNPGGDGQRSNDSATRYDEPATDAARQWAGFGTALKPATEHWILVRKPLADTVAGNVQTYGTGGLNIDACRISTDENLNGGAYAADKNKAGGIYGKLDYPAGEFKQPEGRWPANLVLSHTEWCEDGGVCLPGCPVALMDAQSGTLKSGALDRSRITAPNQTYGTRPKNLTGTYAPNEDGASRFFYVAKPTTAERELDLELFQRLGAGELTNRKDGSDGLKSPRAGAGRTSRGRANGHPTVKSVSLMTWLCKLVTPPGGLVLDPFAGSGSTGVAALRNGFRFLGWELNPDYHRVAEARIASAKDGPLFARTGT